MTDDRWGVDDDDERDDTGRDGERRRPGPLESEMDSFDDDEFGGRLCGASSEEPVTSFDEDRNMAGESIRMGDESGSLPHWTDPPTGEVPKIEAAEREPTDDLDVWSSFSSDPPKWEDRDPSGAVDVPKDPTGELSWHDDPTTDEDAVPDFVS